MNKNEFDTFYIFDFIRVNPIKYYSRMAYENASQYVRPKKCNLSESI